jgi:uncharacterized membrane protein
MDAKQRYLLLLVTVAILEVMSTLLGGSNAVVRAGSAAALVLVLPGYALTMALFPHGTGTEKLLATLGLSLASVALAGLALNWTPMGLQARSWVVVLSSVTLGAGAMALRRQPGAFPVPVTWPRIGVPLRQVALLGTALVVTVGAVAMATNGALLQRYPGFTQLWIQSADTTDHGAVRVGIRSEEEAPVQYRLVITAEGHVIRTWSAITLDPQQRFVVVVPVPLLRSKQVPIEVLLYRSAAPDQIYRHVVL